MSRMFLVNDRETVDIEGHEPHINVYASDIVLDGYSCDGCGEVDVSQFLYVQGAAHRKRRELMFCGRCAASLFTQLHDFVKRVPPASEVF